MAHPFTIQTIDEPTYKQLSFDFLSKHSFEMDGREDRSLERGQKVPASKYFREGLLWFKTWDMLKGINNDNKLYDIMTQKYETIYEQDRTDLVELLKGAAMLSFDKEGFPGYEYGCHHLLKANEKYSLNLDKQELEQLQNGVFWEGLLNNHVIEDLQELLRHDDFTPNPKYFSKGAELIRKNKFARTDRQVKLASIGLNTFSGKQWDGYRNFAQNIVDSNRVPKYLKEAIVNIYTENMQYARDEAVDMPVGLELDRRLNEPILQNI